jgi:hypothetical protein
MFLIGRRPGDEDQLTEMLAFLWQEQPDLAETWLGSLGLTWEPGLWEIETQFVLPSGKRPDIAITTSAGRTLIESKLGSGFGGTQISDYLDYLHAVEGQRALILLTQRPESIPTDLEIQARESGVTLISTRWHEMAIGLADPGDESLAGDFLQLLIREGLVKPEPFVDDDWRAWNKGYKVLLRVDALLNELDPHIRQLDPSLKRRGSPGLTKQWIYRVWRGDSFEVGLGLGAAGGHTPDEPNIFAFVGNPASSREQAVSAVGARVEKPNEWRYDAEADEWYGLLYDWPCIARDAADVLLGESFEDQVQAAAAFVRRAARRFQSRGYLPATPLL